MKLIDANNLFKRTCNTPLYDNQDEDIFLDLILDSKEIDPVHAASGCYCKECIYKEKSTIKNPKDYWCQLRDSYMDLDGFCSEGRKDGTKND